MTMRRRQGKGVETRGVALILVLTTIAILTSIGVDFSYGSRVSLRLAENSRDELRAYYLAKSAVNLSRLLLYFQRQIDLTGGAMARQLLGERLALLDRGRADEDSRYGKVRIRSCPEGKQRDVARVVGAGIAQGLLGRTAGTAGDPCR